MYRILLVFLALLLWGCPKHTPTINDEPLTPKVEAALYKLIGCARFDLSELKDIEKNGYYFANEACPEEENPFGQVDIFLYPKNEQFDVKVVRSAMYYGDKQEWVDVVFNPIKEMSPQQIAQNFNVLLAIVDKKYLEPDSVSGYRMKGFAKIIFYKLKDGHWTREEPISITNNPWNIYEYLKASEGLEEQLIKPNKDQVHITDVTAFVTRIESAGFYTKDKEKSADLNGDGYEDYIFVFSPTNSRMPQQPIIVLLSQEKEQYKVLVNEGLH